MARKRILYYFVMKPFDRNGTYVKAQYTNGDVRYWYPGDQGYKAARAKALRALKGR